MKGATMKKVCKVLFEETEDGACYMTFLGRHTVLTLDFEGMDEVAVEDIADSFERVGKDVE